MQKLKNILAKPLNGFFVLTGLFLLLVSVAAYFLLGKQASDSLVEQMLHREQLAARAGSSSVESFIDLFGKSIVDLATRVEIEKFSKKTDITLNEYVKRWEGTPVAGVVLLDEKGVVLSNGNRNLAPEIGLSLADRDYFPWSKTAKKGDLFISEPLISRLGASKGKYIVVVAAPIVDEGGVFKGLVAASVILEELTDQYIGHLKISGDTRIYLIDNSGVIIASPFERLTGINYLDNILKSNLPGSRKTYEILKNSLASNDEGKMDIALPDETKNGLLTRFLIAKSPINIGGRHWILAIATPASDALAYLAPFYFKDLAVVGVAFLAFLIISIRIAKVVGYKEAVETEHKEHKIKEVDNQD